MLLSDDTLPTFMAVLASGRLEISHFSSINKQHINTKYLNTGKILHFGGLTVCFPGCQQSVVHKSLKSVSFICYLVMRMIRKQLHDLVPKVVFEVLGPEF